MLFTTSTWEVQERMYMVISMIHFIYTISTVSVQCITGVNVLLLEIMYTCFMHGHTVSCSLWECTHPLWDLITIQFMSNLRLKNIYLFITQAHVFCWNLQCKHRSYKGALDRGSWCRLLILRNANVACLCRLFMPMSHVEIKKRLCHMSL